MAGTTDNKPIMTCLLVMLMVASLYWVTGGDAKELPGIRKMDSEGADADDAATGVGSRSVGQDMPRDPAPCASKPCKNRAECVEDGKSYQCICTAGHFGRQCDEEDPCWSSPCQNQGKCIPLDLEYKCKCQPHSTGSNCENSTPSPVHCTQTYCQHGGVCKILSDGHLSCVCAGGYFGHRCQLAAGNVKTNNETNNATDAFPLRRRQHGRSTYDVLMLDIALIGAMSVVFSMFMCVCVVCECKPREPGQEVDSEHVLASFLNGKGTEKTKLLTKNP